MKRGHGSVTDEGLMKYLEERGPRVTTRGDLAVARNTFVLIALLLILSPVPADSTPEITHYSPPIRVAVRVTGEDHLGDEIAGFIARELVALENVEVVESAEDFRLSIVGVKNTLASGMDIGFSLAVTIDQPFDPTLIDVFDDMDPLAASSLKQLTTNLTTVHSRLVFGNSMAGLEWTCERIVAYFDVAVLHEARSDAQLIRIAMESAAARNE